MMKKKVVKIGRIMVLLLFVFIALVLFLPSRTPAFKDSQGKTLANSIACLEKVRLGGVDQYLLIRGKSRDNPVVLFLHGGPGYAQISYARKYQAELEEDFTVVNWDQRGAGKSFSFKIPRETMNRDQFVEDTKELISYLCKKFDKEKIYLVGHSWGSELGLYTAAKYPEQIAAYIGVGQVVKDPDGDEISYNYVMGEAEKANNQKAINDLKRIGKPPYNDPVDGTRTQQKWLSEYGGVERKVHTLNDIVLAGFFSPEYTGADLLKTVMGWIFTSRTMWGAHPYKDLTEDIPELDIPAYFCLGRYDYTTPSELAADYCEKLDAPKKAYYWFEESAHFPNFEEPEKFYSILSGIIRDTE